MFDSPLCDRNIGQFPLFLSGGQLQWLNQLLFGILLVTVVLAVWRWKQQIFKVRVILISLSAIALLAFFFLTVERGLFLPADPGHSVNAIVILGRGQPLRKARVELATELWQEKRSPVIFHSGKGDTPPTIKLLEEKGIPNSAIDGETCSATTPENALFSAAILTPEQYPQIILITDPPHLWRSFLLYRSQGFKVIPRKSPLPANWKFGEKAFLTFREALFLMAYPLGRINPYNPQDIKDTQLKPLIEKAQEYGQTKLFSNQP